MRVAADECAPRRRLLLLIDGDNAEGEHQATAYHDTADGSSAFVAHGRYADRYRRVGGGWRFAHRAFILDWTEWRDLPLATDEFGTVGVATGWPDAGDPVYSLLPGFAADRRSRG